MKIKQFMTSPDEPRVTTWVFDTVTRECVFIDQICFDQTRPCLDWQRAG